MKRRKRIYLEEPKKKFNLEELISQLYQKTNELLGDVKSSNAPLNYKIDISLEFMKRDFKRINEAISDLYQIFIPYFIGRKKSEQMEIPLKPSLMWDGKKQRFILSLSIENSCEVDKVFKNLSTEVSGLLLPKDLRWNVTSDLKLTLGLPETKKEIYYPQIPETEKLSAFDMRFDKERVKEYYSEQIVNEVIKKFCKDRYIRIKWARGCEEPKQRMWKIPKKELLPFPKNLEDYVEEYNMIQIYTSVDRIGEKFPDICVIETDIGDMLKIIDLDVAHKLSFEMTSRISNFLREVGIQNYIHLSGNRSFHIWFGSNLEKPTKAYEEVLDAMEIEDESLRNPYGNLRILGKAIAVHLLRSMSWNVRKRYSIERERLWTRNYKVLIDVLSSKKGAVGCPLSLNAKTGLVYARVFKSKKLSDYYREYKNYKDWCDPEFAIGYAKKYPQTYSEIVPSKEKENLENLSEKLKREIVLVLHTTKKDPNISPDYSFFFSKNMAEKIYSMYFN